MRFVQVDDILDPRRYLEQLPELEGQLPPGAFRFAADAEHYDFESLRCVHDLELGEIRLIDEPGGPVEMRFVGNGWKHDADLLIRYEGLKSLQIGTSTEFPTDHRKLNDLLLDEILPHEHGAVHELVFRAGEMHVVFRDLDARWVGRES